MKDSMRAESLKPANESADLIAIYQCLCDETRLRILHLLANVEQLCVCHFQELLQKPQVQISKHLGYLKERKLVAAEKRANWMIYRLPATPSPELEANLRCLQDCVQTHAVFRSDLKRLRSLQPDLRWLTAPDCCPSPMPSLEKKPPVSKRKRQASAKS